MRGFEVVELLREAVDLLEEYARHRVTLTCNECGNGYEYPHSYACKIGDFVKKVERLR